MRIDFHQVFPWNAISRGRGDLKRRCAREREDGGGGEDDEGGGVDHFFLWRKCGGRMFIGDSVGCLYRRGCDSET